jgi:integrase
LGISLLPEAEPRVRGATAEQEAAVFAVLREDYADLIDFTLLTGMRLDAVISLRWREDVDFAAGTITYQKKRKRGQAVRTGIVPITPEIETILRRQIGRHRLMVWTFVAHRAKGKGFEYEIGKRYPITYWNLRTRWQRAATKAGVPGLRFHDLRHTAALRMLAKTGNLVNVQMMLGHANIATSRKYTEMDLSALRAAMIEAEAARPARVAADASENVVALKRGEAS